MEAEQIRKSIGERIKKLREKKGESQEALGKAINLSQNSISKLENGETQLTMENQFAIAEHFNVSHDYICTGIGNDSILLLLQKYVSLRYTSISDGINRFDCPVLSINRVYFDYLIKSAKAQSDTYIPDEIRTLWLEKEIQSFYAHNKNNAKVEFESLIPLPEELIYPDGTKKEWTQSDLLREMNNSFLCNARTRNKGE
jgi:transcriptional regulator with XRE-family HTH domain